MNQKAYTLLLSSANNIIEERIATTVISREAEILFPLLRFSHYLKTRQTKKSIFFNNYKGEKIDDDDEIFIKNDET